MLKSLQVNKLGTRLAIRVGPRETVAPPEAAKRHIVGLSAGWLRSWYRPSNIVPLCSRRPLKDIVKCCLNVRMNSDEFHILRTNDAMYASKREMYQYALTLLTRL